MVDTVCDNLTVNKNSKMLGDVKVVGKLGIGVENPQCGLDVNAKCIKLGCEINGGGSLRIDNNPNDNKIGSSLFHVGNSNLSFPSFR